jgi:flagellin
MIINTNNGSSTAARILAANTEQLQKSLKRLSTGSKIASVNDDAAGSAVSQKFGAEISRLGASKSNVQNLISLSQTQDSYLDSVSSALDRMSELAMLSTDATKNSDDRALYNAEFGELKEFIGSIIGKTFNGNALFGSTGENVRLDLTSSVTLNGVDLSSAITTLASGATYGIATAASAATALTQINTSMIALLTERADVGSNLTRLEKEHSALATLRDNISAARSRIIDVDVAEESANFAKQQILVQSGTAMLAQANILPQSALRLIS